jgi:hypothetical protein
MNRRRGFALLAVLCTLVIMAMVVAVDAQRALLAARQGVLDLARAETAAAVAGAQAAVLDLPVDTAGAASPGWVLAHGEVTAGAARAQWTLVSTLPPVATVEIVTQAGAVRGSARALHHALLSPVRDSLGGLRWALVGGAGWLRMPSP